MAPRFTPVRHDARSWKSQNLNLVSAYLMAGLKDGEIQLSMLLKYGIQYEEGEGNVGIMDLLLAFLVGAPNLKLTIVKGVYKNRSEYPVS